MRSTNHEVEYLTIHGHRRAFVKTGAGPAILLLHGLGANHTTWEPVIDSLARRYTVIAPDLLGHGRSAKPRADYSVGGYANGMRDLLTVLGIDKVTVVGPQLRRWRGDAVRLPVPRAHRAADPGRLRGARHPGLTADPSHHHAGFRVRHGSADPARRTPRGGRRDARPVAHRGQGVPRLRRGRRHLRDVQGLRRPLGHLPRDAGRGRLARPDRHHGRPRLPHRGDAAVRDLGRGGPGHPGHPRRNWPPRWLPAPGSS